MHGFLILWNTHFKIFKAQEKEKKKVFFQIREMVVHANLNVLLRVQEDTSSITSFQHLAFPAQNRLPGLPAKGCQVANFL